MGLAAASSLLLAGRASAAIESFSAVYGVPTPLGPFGSETLSLSKFDTSLGTLEDVTLTLVSHDTAYVSVYNFNGTPQGFTGAFASVPVTVTVLNGLTATATSAGTLAYGTAAPGRNDFPGITVSSTSSIILGSGFSDYEGMGGQMFNVTVTSGAGTYGGTAIPGVFFGGTAASYGTVEVDYSYIQGFNQGGVESAPEPATYGACAGTLMLLSFGAGMLRDLRQRQAA